MGLYQMLRGEHFLSHTLASLVLVATIVALLAVWLLPQDAGITDKRQDDAR